MKSNIEEFNEIPEMYNIRHKHDNITNDGFNYSDNMLIKTLSPVLYKNDNMDMFLTKLNSMIVTMVESVLPTRNIFYFTHNKYFNGHGR